MLDILLAIALTGVWILGFFVAAQFFHKQFEIARKLDEMKDRDQGSPLKEGIKGCVTHPPVPIRYRALSCTLVVQGRPLLIEGRENEKRLYLPGQELGSRE